MKRRGIYFFLVLSSQFFATCHSQETQRGDTFGKTHFILGLPREQHTTKPIQPSTELNDSVLPFSEKATTIQHAFFSPDDDIKKVLIDLINREKSAIKATVFMLTDKTIAQAFIDAKERGVCVEIIANGDSSKEKFSKITLLQNAGIAVYVYEPENKNSMFSEIMHHKFIIFKKNTHDKALLWTGSFNLTKSANERNHENVIIVEEPGLVRKYDKKFDQLKEMILKHKEALTKKYAHRKNKRSHKKTDEMYCC